MLHQLMMTSKLWFANVYELALFTAQEGNVLAPLVTTFGDYQGLAPRVYGEYSGGTFSQSLALWI